MPAPKFLSGLPKPVLFGLYGAAGGFAGALVLAEPLYQFVLLLERDTRDAARAVMLFVGVSVWTASVAVPLCLALLIGQHHYLRGTAPDANRLAIGAAGAAAAGVVGGLVGQLCFCFAPADAFFNAVVRVVAWALFGGLAGCGLSYFVPNMNRLLGLAGGALGGAVGCLGFLAAIFVVGDAVGRVFGGAALGFCIGVMVVVAETAFRRAWLEVRYGGREVITVNLGPEPVKVGGDAKACTIWARGAPPVALRFFVRDGGVVCDDREAGEEAVAGDGFSREVGNVTVTVRTAEDGGSLPARRPRARRRDEDDTPESPAEPAPLPPASGPPPLPRKPAIKPTARDPNACPSCNRVIPGRAGARYCMVCDQTF